MLNEEYEAYEYLTSLLKVESTKEDPDFPSYGNGTEEWNHVFQNLNLRPFDVILIGYDDHIVGFLTHELKEVTK